MLYGRSNEPSPNHNARECHDVSNNPQSGAMAIACHHPITLTLGTAVETSTTGRTAPRLDRMLGQSSAACAAAVRRCPRDPVASQPDADVIQMTPTTAAARCSCLWQSPRPRSKRRSAPRGRELNKSCAAPRCRGEHQEAATTQMKNDPRFFLLCPANVRAEPRAAATGYHGQEASRLQRELDLVLSYRNS